MQLPFKLLPRAWALGAKCMRDAAYAATTAAHNLFQEAQPQSGDGLTGLLACMASKQATLMLTKPVTLSCNSC